jgi:NAD(P)-dependent dehydrogenase (short-subunit alcohol dehydrogenase family)
MPPTSAAATGRPLALVTGASSGIGLASAVRLSAAGFDVVATMRDTSKSSALLAAAEAAGVAVDVQVLDVTHEESASACVDAVLESGRPIDVLVNNAGAGLVGTLEGLSLDDLRESLETNSLSVARMIKLVLPGMRAHGAGRIVTVTSVGGVVGQPFNDGYCAAKFATEGMLESLAPVAARAGVAVCVVEPGPVATEFVASASASIARARAAVEDDLLVSLFDAYLQRAGAAFAAAQSADEVAAVVVEAATAPEPMFRYQTSAAARGFVGIKLADLDGQQVQTLTSAWLG